MIPQSADRGIGKNEPDETLITGSEVTNERDVFDEDEIDPADFFDPEEFGIRRNVDTRRHA